MGLDVGGVAGRDLGFALAKAANGSPGEERPQPFFLPQSLGTKQWSSGFNIWQADGRSATINMCNPDGSIANPYHLPHTEQIFFQNIYEAKQRGDDFLVMETGGKELEETYNYMFSLPEVKKVLGAMEDIGFQIPKFQVNHCAFFLKVT